MRPHVYFLILVLAFFSLNIFAKGIATGHKKCTKKGSCHGSTSTAKCIKTQKLSLLKNRNTQPQTADFNNLITLDDLYNSHDDTSEFDQSQAVIIQGYLFQARDEDSEACNCYSPYAADHDIHVYIALDKNATSIGDCVVVELTPYSKSILSGWTADYINQNQWMQVEITGWLMYDWEHNNMSFDSGQPKAKAKRRTVWEVHPITNIRSL